MRTRFLFLAICLAVLPGCRFLNGADSSQTTKIPQGSVPPQTAENLVKYLNTQASYLRSLSYTDVRLRATENGSEYPKLADTVLYVAQPKHVRLIAGHSIMGKQLDLGSNDREFWVYAKPLKDNENYFYCSHEDFSRGAVPVPVPFDTDWVMQALNMHTYPDPASGQFTMETKGREYILSQRTSTRNGTPITKITVFNADHDYGRQPVVRRHRVQDDRGQVLAAAEIKQTKVVTLGNDPNTRQPARVQVPTEVTLEWPLQRFKMDLLLKDERVNEDLSDRFALLFERPRISGTQPIDLANYRVQPSSYRGQAPSHESRRAYWWPAQMRR